MNQTCKTCMYSSPTADGVGFYCSHPKKLAIQCVRHDNKYYVAKIDDDAFEQLLAPKQPMMTCDVCEKEEPIPEGKTHPEGWLNVRFKDVEYSTIHLCKICARSMVLNFVSHAATDAGIRQVHLDMMQKYFPSFHKLSADEIEISNSDDKKAK